MFRYLFARYAYNPLFTLLRLRKIFKLYFPEAGGYISCRTATSDLQVAGQIFVHREYQLLDSLVEDEIDTIIDCGANVGYASMYFLNRFPKSRLIAVEPDPDNYDLLKANLTKYGVRAQALCAAVWSKKTNLSFTREPYRDGREWSIQVRECDDGELGTVRAVSISDLIAIGSFKTTSLLKMDIEGAECHVLQHGSRTWFSQIDHFVVELHNDAFYGRAEDIFAKLFPDDEYDIRRHGELTYCRVNHQSPLSGS